MEGLDGGKREKAVVGANFMFFANRAGPCSLDPGVSACFLQGDIVLYQPRDGDWINKQELSSIFPSVLRVIWKDGR